MYGLLKQVSDIMKTFLTMMEALEYDVTLVEVFREKTNQKT